MLTWEDGYELVHSNECGCPACVGLCQDDYEYASGTSVYSGVTEHGDVLTGYMCEICGHCVSIEERKVAYRMAREVDVDLESAPCGHLWRNFSEVYEWPASELAE